MANNIAKRLRLCAPQTMPQILDEAADHIEKLEALLRMIIDWDNTLEFEDGPSWGDVMDNVSKALEGKDESI